jgi:hypothetical protein
MFVTAFHVVGNVPTRRWRHELEEGVSYHLLGDEEVELEHVTYDAVADLALFRPRNGWRSATIFSLGRPAARDRSWRTESFPAFHERKVFTLTGRISEVRGHSSHDALQLLVEQGTHVSWEGVSGSPIVVEDEVVGVITQMTDNAATGWGASVEALARLLKLHDEGDLADATRRLLPTIYRDAQDLHYLLDDLGWSTEETTAATDPGVLVTKIVERAIAEETGFVRLLDEVRNDRPRTPEVRLLRERARREAGRHSGRPGPTRAPTLRLVTQTLNGTTTGVALIEPVGFDARQLLNDLQRHLRRPDETLFAVRLVPDRRSVTPERLYGALTRDLRAGFEEQSSRPLPDEWARHFVRQGHRRRTSRRRSATSSATGSGPADAGSFSSSTASRAFRVARCSSRAATSSVGSRRRG